MSVLLLGGTGAIGTHLKDILAKNDVVTTITSRSMRLNNGTISYIQGNAHDIQFLRDICAIHYDVIVDFMSYKTEEFKERVGTLLKATDQYIYISSARVYSDQEHPIKESSPRLLDVSTDKEYLETDEYALTKARQEDILKKYGSNNYTIVRPYITYSDYRLQLGVLEKEDWLYRALKGRTIVFSSEISKHITTLTNGHDVAYGIYKLMGNKNAFGETFHITSKKLLKWEDVFAIYNNAITSLTGKSLKIKLVDNDTFMTCRGADYKYQVLYDRLYNRDFDTTKESLFLDSNVFVSPDEGLSNCVKAFMRIPIFKKINWSYEGRRDKITHEWTPFTEIPRFKDKILYIISRIF